MEFLSGAGARGAPWKLLGVVQALVTALALAFAAAPAARAAVFTIDSGALVYDDLDMSNFDIYGMTTDESAFPFLSPFTIIGSPGSIFQPETAQTILAFCLNPFASAPMGGPGLGLPYFDGSIDADLVPQILALVEFGNDLYDSGDLAGVKLQLAAVQGAIWQVLFPAFTFTGIYDNNTTSGYSEPITGLIAQYAAGVGVPASDSGLTLRVLQTDVAGLQSLAVLGPGAVPEPGTWALMIVGFLGAGVMVRRRRLGTT